MAAEAPHTHRDFVDGYSKGWLKATVDADAAARFLSGRMLLPFILLPVFGAGVALALAGHAIAGIAVFVGGFAFRFVVRRSAPGFVLRRALESELFYGEALTRGLLRLHFPAQSRDSS